MNMRVEKACGIDVHKSFLVATILTCEGVKGIRELRDLTRTRTKTIQTMTAFKNRVHKVLEKANIRISGVLSELFGIAGLQILNGILNRKDIDEEGKKDSNSGISQKTAEHNPPFAEK